jgi:hypothetical protein
LNIFIVSVRAPGAPCAPLACVPLIASWQHRLILKLTFTASAFICLKSSLFVEPAAVGHLQAAFDLLNFASLSHVPHGET